MFTQGEGRVLKPESQARWVAQDPRLRFGLLGHRLLCTNSLKNRLSPALVTLDRIYPSY